ncbi:hypothetical protein NGRA_3415, partial [Nosema granulosis]
MEDKDNKFIMVENNIIKPKDDIINAQNIVQELKKLKNLSFFINLKDDQKVEYVLSRACYDLIDWHCTLKIRKTSWTYEKWKNSVVENYGVRKMEIGDIYRFKQDKSQSIVDFLKSVEKACEENKIKTEEKIKIMLTVMHTGYNDIRRLIIREKNLDSLILEDIIQLEKFQKEEEKKVAEAKSEETIKKDALTK